MKLSDAQDDRLVAAYIQIRDRRAQRKAAFDNEDFDDKAKQEKIEAEFISRFNTRGAQSVRTEFGTAYRELKSSATVADREAYVGWILESPQERLVFLDVKANKTSVKEYRAANDDIPPGLNWSETICVNFRRA